jgi:hypothetical protein
MKTKALKEGDEVNLIVKTTGKESNRMRVEDARSGDGKFYYGVWQPFVVAHIDHKQKRCTLLSRGDDAVRAPGLPLQLVTNLFNAQLAA